jgi:hypothetical protein
MERKMIICRAFLLAFLFAVSPVLAQSAKQATLYKNPDCGCCDGYAAYLRENGFRVKVIPTHDLTLIKKRHSVAAAFEGCHTTLIDRYVVEGHVPVASINKLLAERPDIKGISLPGMPEGSPGMSGTKDGPWPIYEIGSDPNTPRVFAVE